MGQRAIAITTSNFNMENQLLDEFRGDGWEIVRSQYGRKLTESEVSELLSDGAVVGILAGVEPLTDSVFAANPQLKVISRCGTGFDSVDLAAAAQRGIACLNTPQAPAAAVSELTIGMMMAALRRIPQSDRLIRGGTWKAIMGSLLAKRTVGVVGLGRVGTRVADLVTAFGADVLYYDPHVATVEYDRVNSVKELAARVDLLTIHTPLAEDTRNLVSAEVIEALPQGAIVVNASRGGVMDEDALVAALKSGKLDAAALDVFADEPYTGPLKDFDNVVLTAHMGSYAREARQLMESEALQNLLNALRKLDA
ncbi:MAG: NAD(P)-dependent oxidoreductase [Acidimicrobiia bacterium]